jgi:hypothetical protein
VAFALEKSLMLRGLPASVINYVSRSRQVKSITDTVLRRFDQCDDLTTCALERRLELDGKSINVLSGYFQNYEIFKTAFPLVRDAWSAKLESIANRYGDVDFARDAIIHLRRGDYAKYDFPILPTSCYLNAIDTLRRSGFEGKVFAVTDDPIALLSDPDMTEIKLVDIEDPLLTIAFFSRFKHKVTANSTLSLWAALLGRNDSRVVVPTAWPAFANELSAIGMHMGWCKES